MSRREELALDGHGVAKDRHRASAPSDAWEDARLIARIREHDLQAFEELYRNYRPRLARFLTNLIHRPQLVEEVFNDTMLVIWNRPDSFAGGSKLSTWIFAIAYRKAMKALRRRDEPVEDIGAETRVSPDVGPEQQAGQQQVREVLLNAINQLSPDHRAVVDLTYFHEIGYREIAEIMDCPVDTVKTRMFHARRHLKRLLAGALSDWL
jgi:RNA polymerase sigma-70 factor (ECF subfamily)